LIARNGCRSGTRVSGDTKVTIVGCFVSRPRMVPRDHSLDLLSIPCRLLFQHPVRTSYHVLRVGAGGGRNAS
jgi:hypothetical protein